MSERFKYISCNILLFWSRRLKTISHQSLYIAMLGYPDPPRALLWDRKVVKMKTAHRKKKLSCQSFQFYFSQKCLPVWVYSLFFSCNFRKTLHFEQKKHYCFLFLICYRIACDFFPWSIKVSLRFSTNCQWNTLTHKQCLFCINLYVFLYIVGRERERMSERGICSISRSAPLPLSLSN